MEKDKVDAHFSVWMNDQGIRVPADTPPPPPNSIGTAVQRAGRDDPATITIPARFPPTTTGAH
jgi:hypothetical protein